MEGFVFERGAEESQMNDCVPGAGNKNARSDSDCHCNKRPIICNSRGIALVTTLLLSLAGLAIATGIIYFLMQSVAMSGAGKRYATASEAADGAVEVMKDAVNLLILGEPASSLPIRDSNNCLTNCILNVNGVASCTTTLTLPSDNFFTDWNASITVTRLYSLSIEGSRLEFARAGGLPGTAIYFRITTVVTGPGNAKAETSALYRYAG